MKQMLRGFALILALTLAATLCIPAFAAEGATESERNIELPTDEVLLATVQDNIDAYAEYYFLHSVTVIDKFVSKYENDSYDVDFIIDLETELKYDSAAQLPHVQGMTKSLGINSEATTTDRLIASLAEDSPTMAIAEMTLETLENKENISSNDGLAAVTKEKTAVQIATTAIADLVTELEDLYIGEISSTILSFRATFDNQGMPVSVAAVAYDGSAYDAKLLVPPSAEEMEHNGELQLADIVNAAVIAAEEPQMATQATATKETYHRVTARDYANTWTSTQPTGKKDTSKWRIAANPNAYAPLYPANSSDCANYVSQAMFAGGIKKSSSDVDDEHHWFASQYGCSRAWESCTNMHSYFTENDYWTASDFKNCNAGGVIFLKDTDGDRFHVVMCVQNDTVTRKYSAHTTDKKQEAYTGRESFGKECASLEYWVFTNSSAD